MDDDEAFKRIEKSLHDCDNFDETRKQLAPLVERNHPGAIRLNASIFPPGMSEEDMDRIHVNGIHKSAELGDLKARYIVGCWHDTGEYGHEFNPLKASRIFAKLAHQGHPHSTWIYACDMLWGKGAFQVAIEDGLAQLNLAIARGSADAAITKARLYDEGLFGFTRSSSNRDIWRVKAKKIDEDVYDPYDD